MLPTLPLDTTLPACHADACLPCFLDDSYHAGPDDGADWWLDLGSVALPAR